MQVCDSQPRRTRLVGIAASSPQSSGGAPSCRVYISAVAVTAVIELVRLEQVVSPLPVGVSSRQRFLSTGEGNLSTLVAISTSSQRTL